MGRAVLGGVLAGAFGAAVWVAIGYFLNAEVGYVAWGIGLIVGIGVAAGSEESVGAGTGIIATVIAVASVLVGKYLVVYFLAHNMVEEMPAFDVSDNDIVHTISNEIIEEKELTPLEFADDVDFDMIPDEQEYPPGVWQEAQAKFAELSPEQVEAKKEEQREMLRMITSAFESAIREEGFKESFNFFDLLWFGLAAFTAFQVGSGGGDD